MQTMNANLFFLQQENFSFVKVVFDGHPKTYLYKTTLELEKDDKVIVDSPSSGLVIVTVVDTVDPLEVNLDAFNYKWVVSKVDLEYYNKLQEVEKQVQREVNKAKASAARKQMEEQLIEQIGEDAFNNVKGLVRL